MAWERPHAQDPPLPRQAHGAQGVGSHDEGAVMAKLADSERLIWQLNGKIQRLTDQLWSCRVERDEALIEVERLHKVAADALDRECAAKATIERIRAALDECRGQSSQVDNLIDDIDDAIEGNPGLSPAAVTELAACRQRHPAGKDLPEWTTFAPTHADIQAALDRRAQ